MKSCHHVLISSLDLLRNQMDRNWSLSLIAEHCMLSIVTKTDIKRSFHCRMLKLLILFLGITFSVFTFTNSMIAMDEFNWKKKSSNWISHLDDSIAKKKTVHFDSTPTFSFHFHFDFSNVESKQNRRRKWKSRQVFFTALIISIRFQFHSTNRNISLLFDVCRTNDRLHFTQCITANDWPSWALFHPFNSFYIFNLSDVEYEYVSVSVHCIWKIYTNGKAMRTKQKRKEEIKHFSLHRKISFSFSQ